MLINFFGNDYDIEFIKKNPYITDYVFLTLSPYEFLEEHFSKGTADKIHLISTVTYYLTDTNSRLQALSYIPRIVTFPTKSERSKKQMMTLMRIARNAFTRADREQIFLILFNNRCRIIFSDILHDASTKNNYVMCNMIEFEAIRHNASYVFIAHNHPSGIAEPSTQDIEQTKRIALNLKKYGILLLDHVICTHEKCVSILASQDFYENNE